MTYIADITARQILDSRGNPTVEVDVILEDGSFGRASAPSGASTGTFEAIELRDGDEDYYRGKSVNCVIDNLNSIIAPQLTGLSALNQREVDNYLCEMDGTENKSNLGANITIATSIAVAKAASNSLGIPLYKYLGGVGSYILPTPMFNIINGGEHGDNDIDVQEYMIVPHRMATFSDALRTGSDIYHNLKEKLKEEGYNTSVGDEGGFAPQLEDNERALSFISDSIEGAGYIAGEEVSIALDVAASEFYNDGIYTFKSEGRGMPADDLVSLYEEWLDSYPIVSIEDGLAEEDWAGWKMMTERLGERVQLVGDDIFVTNIERIGRGIDEEIANAVLIKPNQIGTLSETIDAIDLSRRAGYSCVMSHRSGETGDVFISDLAVGLSILQMKSGAPCRGERVSKYNQLLRIEEGLGIDSEFSGHMLYGKYME